MTNSDLLVKRKMTEDAHPSGYRWIILVLVWLVYFAFGLILSSIPPLVTIIATDLSLTYSEMGVIMGSVILMFIPFAVPIGIGIDRFGQKRMISIGLLFISSSAILRSFTISFETLFLVVLLFGVGGPTISVGLAKVVASFFEGKERGIASGIYMTGATVGSGSALALTNSLVLPLIGTWRNVFSFYGIIGFLIAFAWILLARESSPNSKLRPAGLSLKKVIRSLLSNRYVWMVAIIGSTSFLVFYGFGNWLPALLEEKGMDPAGAGLLASIPTWVGLIGSGIIPGATRTGKRKPVIVALLFIEGICMYIVGITSGTSLLILLVVYGIVSGAVMPLMLVVMMDLPKVGAEYTGIATGLFFSVGGVMGFIGPSLVGYVTDIYSNFLPALIILAIIVEAMIAGTLFLKDA